MVCFLVGCFDGLHICVGAADQDVVEPVLARAGAFERFVEAPYVLLEGAAEDAEKAVFEVARCFAFDVLFEIAPVPLVVGC